MSLSTAVADRKLWRQLYQMLVRNLPRAIDDELGLSYVNPIFHSEFPITCVSVCKIRLIIVIFPSSSFNLVRF